MKSISNAKIYYPETIPDQELPESVLWEDVVDAPRTLSELSRVDGERLDTVEAEVDSGFSDISIQGWVNDMVFSATDHNTVAWTSGTIRFKDGTAYSIGSGNTGNMSAITYIYLDIAVSTTALQTTTNSANAVGSGKLLVGVAQNVASGKDAIFQMFGGAGGVGVLLTADNIASNSITANEIQTNTITTLTLTAGSITGMLFRTATSGVRIEMDTTNVNQLRFYDATTLFGKLEAYKIGSDGYIGLIAQDDGAGFEVYTGIGASAYSAVTIFSNGGSFTSDGNATNGFNFINGKYGGYFGVSGSGGAGPDYISTDLAIDADWIPYTGGYDLGSSGTPWARGYFEDLFVSDDLTVTDTIIYGGVTIPTLYHGYVNSNATFGNPTQSGWSVSSSSTGIYTVTHNFGNVGYAVQVVAKASTVKNITVSDKSSNSFTVRVANLSDTLEDNDFMFLVTRTI